VENPNPRGLLCRALGAGNGFARAVKEVQRATAVVVQTSPFLADMVVDGPFRDRVLALAGKGLARTIQALAAGAAGTSLGRVGWMKRGRWV
jgi:hypothetical protein